MLVRSSVVMRKLSGLRAFMRGQLDLRLVVVRWCDLVGGGGRGGGGSGGNYGWSGASRVSKILLGDIICSSSKWLFCVNSLYM